MRNESCEGDARALKGSTVEMEVFKGLGARRKHILNPLEEVSANHSFLHRHGKMVEDVSNDTDWEDMDEEDDE